MYLPLQKASSASIAILMLAVFAVASSAQQAAQTGADTQPDTLTQPGASPTPTDPDRLPDAPPDVTSIAHTFRLTPIKGLSRPFALAFVPDGSVLVTERAGRLRVVRNGVLDPRPIGGMPEVLDLRLKGLQDIALHPRFPENRLIYFTYYKPKPGEKDVATATLGRARWEGGNEQTKVEEIYE